MIDFDQLKCWANGIDTDAKERSAMCGFDGHKNDIHWTIEIDVVSPICWALYAVDGQFDCWVTEIWCDAMA